MTDFTLRLRPELSLVRDGASLSLEDSLLHRTVALDARLGAALSALATPLSIDAFYRAMARAQVTRPEAAEALRTLFGLNLFEDTFHELIAGLRARREGFEPARGRVLGETRFECLSSGDCCHTHRLGPLRPEDLAYLAAIDPREHYPDVAWPPVETRTLSNKLSGDFFRERPEGGCVFLIEERHCGLKRHYREAPPSCQRLGLDAVLRADGVHVYNTGRCHHAQETSDLGPALAKTPRRLLPLMQRPLPLEHPMVALGQGVIVDDALYRPWVDEAVEACNEAQLHPAEIVRLLGRRVLTLRDQFKQVQPQPGVMGALVQSLKALPRVRFEVPPRPENLSAGLVAAARLSEALLQAAERAGGAPLSRDRQRAEQLKPLAYQLHTLAQAMTEGAPPPERLIALGSISLDNPLFTVLNRRQLQQDLFGRGALLHARAFAGLLRLGLYQWLVAAAARALNEGQRVIQERTWGEAHQRALGAVLLPEVESLSLEAEAAAPAFLEALPWLVRWR